MTESAVAREKTPTAGAGVECSATTSADGGSGRAPASSSTFTTRQRAR